MNRGYFAPLCSSKLVFPRTSRVSTEHNLRSMCTPQGSIDQLIFLPPLHRVEHSPSFSYHTSAILRIQLHTETHPGSPDDRMIRRYTQVCCHVLTMHLTKKTHLGKFSTVTFQMMTLKSFGWHSQLLSFSSLLECLKHTNFTLWNTQTYPEHQSQEHNVCTSRDNFQACNFASRWVLCGTTVRAESDERDSTFFPNSWIHKIHCRRRQEFSFESHSYILWNQNSETVPSTT